MSTAYSITGWLNLISDYCCGACWRKATTVLNVLIITWGIPALKRHNSEMPTMEVTDRVLTVSDILSDSCTKHLMSCWNHICGSMLLSFACIKKERIENMLMRLDYLLSPCNLLALWPWCLLRIACRKSYVQYHHYFLVALHWHSISSFKMNY